MDIYVWSNAALLFLALVFLYVSKTRNESISLDVEHTLSQISILCVYRLFFHPFSKYPGPFWAKLTDGFAGFHAYKQDTHLEIWETS